MDLARPSYLYCFFALPHNSTFIECKIGTGNDTSNGECNT